MSLMPQLILLPLSTLYSAVTRTRLAAYKKGFFSVTKLDAPVISIGNITTGGTGKTPLVEWVCRTLASKGKRVCVLTRGYGRVNPNARIVVSDGKQMLANPIEAGDEPFLLAQNLDGLAAVISDADRVAAGRWAIQELGSDVFVLDDGFQHLRIARELNIVTIDATNPWGGGQLLPYGRLRESRRGLGRADCIVITRAEQAENLHALKQELRKLTSAPLFVSRMETRSIEGLATTALEQPAVLTQPLGAFCAVGNPKSFFEHLHRDGHTLAFARAFADHYAYSQADIDFLVEEANGLRARALITTAKDAVKLRNLSFALPCYVLEVGIVIKRAHVLRAMLDHTLSTSSADNSKLDKPLLPNDKR
jgi:tetraacyldisaccharide 4'-kinase